METKQFVSILSWRWKGCSQLVKPNGAVGAEPAQPACLYLEAGSWHPFLAYQGSNLPPSSWGTIHSFPQPYPPAASRFPSSAEEVCFRMIVEVSELPFCRSVWKRKMLCCMSGMKESRKHDHSSSSVSVGPLRCLRSVRLSLLSTQRERLGRVGSVCCKSRVDGQRPSRSWRSL